MIQNHINQTRQIDPDSKYLLLKHHHWLNMTKLGLEQVRIRKFTFVISISSQIRKFQIKLFYPWKRLHILILCETRFLVLPLVIISTALAGVYRQARGDKLGKMMQILTRLWMNALREKRKSVQEWLSNY